MVFPLEITYKKRLAGEIDKISTDQILSFAEEDFIKSDAIKVNQSEDSIIVNNPFGFYGIRRGLNWNRWIGISHETFQINDTGNMRFVNYTINLTRIWIVGIISGLLFWGFSQDYWTGIIAFGALGLLNWIGKLIQHSICFYGTFTDIMYENKHKDKQERES
jgi:hypothetical protein